MQEISYTPEEVAKLLRVSKLTVYDLIKKGNLPAYRVGKQMRIDAADLEAYKLRAKEGHVSFSRSIPESPLKQGLSVPGVRPIVITGQDVSLDILTKYIEKTTKTVRPLRSYVGSLDSLISMYQGQSDVVSTHLLDGDTGEYNISYIRKILVGFPYIVMNLCFRTAGFYVQKGNPKQIRSWDDLKKPGLTIVNREKGSGARVLLDEQLRLHGISPEQLKGYEVEESNHLAVAGKVSQGQADVGVGIEKAAYIVGVDFVPLIQERYDLVMLKTPQNREWIEIIKEILQSEAFRNELKSIRGYDLSRTGEIIFEA
jgi:putative molybdopterin biosynthesis protein